MLGAIGFSGPFFFGSCLKWGVESVLLSLGSEELFEFNFFTDVEFWPQEKVAGVSEIASSHDFWLLFCKLSHHTS